MNAAMATLAAAATAIFFPLFGARRRSQVVDSTVPSSIFHIAALLRRLPLPAEVIPSILDYAAVWHQIEGPSTTRRMSVAQNMSGTIYHTAAIPEVFAPSSLRTISFTVRSHDQAYSWDTSNHGTYNGSWTWLGAMVTPRQELESAEHGIAVAGAARLEGERIITNVHASGQPKTYTVTWRYDDETEAINTAFKSMRDNPKDSLMAITACARYPGWSNHVEYARIDFGYQPIRKM